MNRWFALPLFAVLAVAATVGSVLLVHTSPARAADDAAAAKPDDEGFVELFNGKDLDGWKVGDKADAWKVEDGELIVHNGPSHLFYDGPVHDHDWKNFHLRAVVMTRPHANSGIYFHTKFQESGWPAQGFEAQVNQTHSDPKKTGGLYAVKDVMNIPPAEDDKWFTYDIIVEGKHVILKIDGKVTTDWTEPDPAQPPKGMPGRFIQHGTIALQGHDPKSETHFKSVKIKALPD